MVAEPGSLFCPSQTFVLCVDQLFCHSLSSGGMFLCEGRKGGWICIKSLQSIQCLIILLRGLCCPGYKSLHTFFLSSTLFGKFLSQIIDSISYISLLLCLSKREKLFTFEEMLWFRWARSGSPQSPERRIQERK